MSSHLSFLDDDALEALNVLAIAPGMQKEFNLAAAETARVLAATTSMPTAGEAGVITATGSDVPNSESHYLVEALLHKDFFAVSVRVAACIDLIARLALRPAGATSSRNDNKKWRHDLDRFQVTLSHLLVRYPVLMHSHIVIAVKDQNGKLDYAPVATAIARTGLATLPRVSHGVSEVEIRKFASYVCVKHGMVRASPDRKIKSSTTAHRTVPSIAFDPTRIVDRAWHAGAPFVSSLLEINELARQETGRPILRLRQSSSERDGLMTVCASGGHLLANTPTASGNLQVWQRALQVNETKVVMHSVIVAARAGVAASQESGSADRPANRCRMRVI